MIPSRVTRVLVDTLLPWMLMRSTLSRQVKEKGSSSPRDGCSKCGGAHFQRDCNARIGKQSSGKGKQSKSWSKNEGKGKSKENKEKSKGTSKGSKGAIQGAKAHTRVKHRKLFYQVLKTRNLRQARILKNLHRRVLLTMLGVMMDGVLMNGMIGWMARRLGTNV